MREAANLPHSELLQELLDMTPAQAQLALALARGISLQKYAAEAGISISTARKYAEVVFSKTNTHQQHALVALLKSVAWPKP
ncbi:hypothetical protein FQV27_18045 [Paracoccus aurantiacus]|uniref:Helix-turn-helix transcriptional regulator n=1 Tax=Paracoccus aurantiacus TaxID=2599412 RepID=A0A5C6RQ87_9RHOB|nr:hypothetical protein FQV27_18045 [Paracoccus aurantiacus]